jgi:RNA polymerase sigma-70 factor (ECF subfamily)
MGVICRAVPSHKARHVRHTNDEPKRKDVTVDSKQWQLEEFERNRAHLRAVAQRMLGSAAEADDAVQEAWLRLDRTDTAEVDNMAGWLTTVVARICLDMLRARQSRREELVDGWFPEPIVPLEDGSDPEREALIADSVGVALLVVLETLTPAERLAFVLHDMFGVSFTEIAPIVDRSVDATRQLASRARRRVRGAQEPRPASIAQQRKVVEAFLAASRSGDFEALLAVLDPEVVFRADGGSIQLPVPSEVHGATEVAKTVMVGGTPFAPFGRPAIVNGRVGVVVRLPDRLAGVVSFTIAGDRVTEIELVADPIKLAALRV